MSLFSRNKKDQSSGPLAPEKRRISASGAGRNAFWGGAFRTASFEAADNPVARRFCQKAVRRTDGTWSVHRVTEHDGSETVASEKERLDFFDALDCLARFEAGSKLDVTLRPAFAGEKESLGFSHYQAFGEREGLKFDENGLPHETENGETVTAGTFQKTDIESFKSRYEPAQAEVKAAFNAASAEEVYKLLDKTVDKGALDDALALLRKRDTLRPLKEPAYGMLKSWESAINYGHDHLVEYPALSKRKYPDDECWADRVGKLMKELNSTFKNYKGEADADEISRGITICQLAWDLSCARQAFRDRAKKDGSEKEVLKFKNECADSLKKLGLPEADARQVEASILAGLDADDRQVPQVVRDFVAAIENADRNVLDETRQLIRSRTKAAALTR